MTDRTNTERQRRWRRRQAENSRLAEEYRQAKKKDNGVTNAADGEAGAAAEKRCGDPQAPVSGVPSAGVPAPHPGKVLNDLLLALKVTPGTFARRIGINRQNVHKLLHGQDGISIGMAHRLGQAFGTGPYFWLILQMLHEVFQFKPDAKIARIEAIEATEEGLGGRKSAFTKSKLRQVQAALANRDRDRTVMDLCAELGVDKSNLYRYVRPGGKLTIRGEKLINREEPELLKVRRIREINAFKERYSAFIKTRLGLVEA